MKKKILWLTSWYPNKLEPLSGDFIERHAKAASLLNDITVIHVVKDHLQKTTGNKTIIRNQYPDHPALIAIIGYYKSPDKGVFPTLVSLVRYFRFQQRLISDYIRENGKPDIINIHISFKAGLGALYCKWRYGVKYIVSEQWTIFCPEAKPSFYDQPFFARNLIRRIYRNADGFSAVSHYLAQSLAKQFRIKLPVRVPNVVDTNLFFPSASRHHIFTFIHISVLNYQKSPQEIIEAAGLLKRKTNKPFRLVVYGPVVNEIAEKIKTEGLEDVIDYRGEVAQFELSEEVRKCHSLLLYSRFETFGCVVIEALASGLPVIVSDIPVMHELVEENESGIFAAIDNPDELAEKMLLMMENYHVFDQQKISQAAGEKYAFRKIAEEFDFLYAAVTGIR